MDPDALRAIQDLAHAFGGDMPRQKRTLLQDEHGQYEDMEANGHRAGDDIGDKTSSVPEVGGLSFGMVLARSHPHLYFGFRVV